MEKKMAEMQRRLDEIQNQQQGSSVATNTNPSQIVERRVLTRDEVPKDVESYEIPYGITEIGDNAFMKEDVRYAIMPNGAIEIADCNSDVSNTYVLKNVTIPNSVTKIGKRAFQGCAYLNNITIPNSVTFIGMEAFGMCVNMNYIIFEGSNTTIGKNCFHTCNSLQTIYVPKGSRAFYEAQLPKKLRKLIVEQ